MSEDPLNVLSAAAEEWGAPLDAQALARLRSYLLEVQAKNAVTNLTADDSWDDLVLKHAADGVFAACALRRELRARGSPERPRVLDLGAGGGFIGFALKIAWPEAEVTLMEAVERKYRFLNAASSSLGLKGLRPVLRRAGAGPPRSASSCGGSTRWRCWRWWPSRVGVRRGPAMSSPRSPIPTIPRWQKRWPARAREC